MDMQINVNIMKKSINGNLVWIFVEIMREVVYVKTVNIILLVLTVKSANPSFTDQQTFR